MPILSTNESMELQIQCYMDFIMDYQKRYAVRLVSQGDLSILYQRHIEDCGQIFPYWKPQNHDIFMDLGCGAGFFGILSIILHPESQHRVILCDKDKKKGDFLQKLVTLLHLDSRVIVHNASVRHYHGRVTVVAMRALGSVPWFFESLSHINKNAIKGFIFKTEKQHQEWSHHTENHWLLKAIIPNQVLQSGVILHYES